MNVFKLIYIVPVIALLFLSGCEKNVVYVDIGRPAPDFPLKNIDGGNTKLSDHMGKVVMIEFWATWCPPCKESVPELNGIYLNFRDRNFVLLAVSVDEGSRAVEELKKFREKFDVLYPIYLDTTDADRLYGVIRIPTTVLIDKNGLIASIYLGYRPGLAETLAKEIEALL